MVMQLVLSILFMTSYVVASGASEGQLLLEASRANQSFFQTFRPEQEDPYEELSDEQQRKKLIKTLKLNGRLCCCMNQESRDARKELYYEHGPWNTEACSINNCTKHVVAKCHQSGCSLDLCQVPCTVSAAGLATAGFCVMCFPPATLTAGAVKTLSAGLLISGLSAIGFARCLDIRLSEWLYEWTSNPDNWSNQNDDDALVSLLAREE